MTSVYVQAKVDLDDFLSDVSPEDLTKGLRSELDYEQRHALAKALLADKPFERRREEKRDELSEFVEEALALLRAGRPDDAELVLERAAHPKWPTAEHALLAFKSVRQ